MSTLTDPRFLDIPTITHDEFLREKVAFDKSFGFPVHDDDLDPVLKPHQRDIVKWAILGGRRAIFAKFGLGKSIMQMETLRQILTHPVSPVVGGRALIIAPLGVRGEFVRDGRDHLGIEVRFIRRTDEIEPGWSGIYVTNYESVRDGRLAVDGFDAVSLDDDPFGGLGTVPLRARKLGRQGRASELNPTSFRDAVMYQRELDSEMATPSLFDLLAIEGGTAA